MSNQKAVSAGDVVVALVDKGPMKKGEKYKVNYVSKHIAGVDIDLLDGGSMGIYHREYAVETA